MGHMPYVGHTSEGDRERKSFLRTILHLRICYQLSQVGRFGLLLAVGAALAMQ
jgi:hypothetical protein